MDIEEDHREVWAHFGVVAFQVSHLEEALVTILLALAKRDGRVVTPEQFDQMERRIHFIDKKTLGTLLKDVRKVVPATPEAEAVLKGAVERRNYLMHHFFRERLFALSTVEGRQRMLAELEEAQESIFLAVQSALGVLNEIGRQSGITREEVEQEAEMLRQQAQ